MSHRGLAILVSAVMVLGMACGGAIDSGSGGGNPRPPFDSGPETSKASPLGRGVNLGNMLEAPAEYPDTGHWGLAVKEEYFSLIKGRGFDTVRIPIRWASRTGTTAPYAIDPAFLARIDEVVGWAQAQGLNILINCHHWTPEDALFSDPAGQHDRFIEIWKQVAARFKDAPASLYYEVLNEPHGNLDASAWNGLLADAVIAIRAIDADRTLVIGGAGWNGAAGLNTLEVPLGETNYLATFHFYSPFPFTHQGAEWADPIPPTGVTWPGSSPSAACQAIRDELDGVKAWSDRHPGVPVLMGEFGAYSRGDMASRAHWTAYVRKQAEERGFSWAYWEFCAGFGVYNPDLGTWNEELMAALGL